MTLCRNGVDICGDICRNGVPADDICRNGQSVCAPTTGFASSLVVGVIDDRLATPLNDANALIAIGAGNPGLPGACVFNAPFARNGGVDTSVTRVGAPDIVCTAGTIASPVGAYITEVINPGDINGVRIDILSSSGVRNHDGVPLSTTVQGTDPVSTSHGVLAWTRDNADAAAGAYVPGTWFDPSMGTIHVGVFADATAPNQTQLGHTYTAQVEYFFRYVDNTVISVVCDLTASACNNTPPP